MLNDFMSWFAGNAWSNSFWSAPAGIFTLIIIFICSLGNILCDWVEDSFSDRIFYSIYALCSLSTLVHVYTGSEPFNVIKTMMFAMAVNFLVNFYARLRHRLATGHTVKIDSRKHF